MQPLWAVQTRLVDIFKRRNRAGFPEVGPWDWDTDQSEFIKRILSVDLGAGAVDTRLLSSPLLGMLAKQLDLEGPQVHYSSPAFAAYRARYLALSSDICLTRWLTADDSPHEATAGLLQSYLLAGGPGSKRNIDHPDDILCDGTPDMHNKDQISVTGRAVLEARAATSIVDPTGTAMTPISQVMGIVRQLDTYHAFTISLGPHGTEAIIFDPFPESSLNSWTRSLLEALARACGSMSQVEIVDDENIGVSPLGDCPSY
jgi:hypothetical protein